MMSLQRHVRDVIFVDDFMTNLLLIVMMKEFKNGVHFAKLTARYIGTVSDNGQWSGCLYYYVC